MSSRRSKSRLFRFHLVLWGISVQWSRSLWLWVSNSNLFCLIFVSIEMSGSSPLRLLLRSISWTFEGFFTQNLRQRMISNLSASFLVSFENCERWCLIMKIPGFRSACSCLYSKGRCGWWETHSLNWQWLSFQTPHSRWLHHLQTHNGNAGRNSKRLQRSWWENIFKFKLGILKPDGFQLSKQEMTTWRVADALRRFFFQEIKPRDIEKSMKEEGLCPSKFSFCLCKLHDTTRCLGKIKILIHVSSFRLFACEVLWRCGHLATTEHCRATTSRLEVASTDDDKDFFKQTLLMFIKRYLEKMTYFVCKRVVTTSKMITHSIGFVFLYHCQVPSGWSSGAGEAQEEQFWLVMTKSLQR